MSADFLRQLKNKLELDLSEYALYEKEILPERDEIERFNHSVDELRDDLERLWRGPVTIFCYAGYRSTNREYINFRLRGQSKKFAELQKLRGQSKKFEEFLL